jgi:hypothetical protein
MNRSSSAIWDSLSKKAQRRLVRRGVVPWPDEPCFDELKDAGLVVEVAYKWQWTEDADEVTSYGAQALSWQVDHLQEQLLYFTECQLATVQELEGLARPPKGRLRRHRDIAEKMMMQVKLHNLTSEDASRARCTRVQDLLTEKAIDKES